MAQQHLAQDLVNFGEYHFGIPENSGLGSSPISNYMYRGLFQSCDYLGYPFDLVAVLDWTLLSINLLFLQECSPLLNPFSPIWISFPIPHSDVPLLTTAKRLQFHRPINDEYYLKDHNGSHKRSNL